MKILNPTRFAEKLNIGKLNIRDIDIPEIRPKVEFEKSSLRSGMIVMTKCGGLYVVLREEDIADTDLQRLKYIFSLKPNNGETLFYHGSGLTNSRADYTSDGYMSLSSYDGNLMMKNKNSKYDIVEIYNVCLDVTDIKSYEIENLEKVVMNTPLYKVSKRTL